MVDQLMEGIPVITVEELVNVIRTAPSENTIMAWGPPGIGKTQGIRKGALLRYQDITGKPLPEDSLLRREICMEEILSSKQPEDLEGVMMRKEIAGEVYSHIAPPARFEPLMRRDETPRTLFLDEINQARPHVQVIGMQIALEKRIGSVWMAPETLVVAAGNRLTDRAAVNMMPKSLENRLEHYQIKVDLDLWVRWAFTAGIDPILIGYVRSGGAQRLMQFNPDSKSPAWASPRSYEMADRRIKRHGWENEMLPNALSACLGDGTSNEILAYRRLKDELPDVNEILTNGRTAPAPELPDRCYFVLSAVTAALMQNSSEERLAQAFFYVTRMSAEYGVKLVRDVMTLDTENKIRKHLPAVFAKNPELTTTYKEKWAPVLELVKKAA